MSEVIFDGGGNNYLLLHMDKHTLVKAQGFPKWIHLTTFAMQHLHIGPKGLTIAEPVMVATVENAESNDDSNEEE